MDNNNTIDNLKSIREVAKNTVLFNMAISHLFACGMESFSEEAYNTALDKMKESHRQAAADGTHRFMTLEFEKALLDAAYQLSKYPLFDILLYIKKHMVIYDPEAARED